MMPRAQAVAAGVLAASALALAACAAAPGPQAQVPTLATSGSATPPTPAGTSAGADAGRPRERLDMTNDEIVALYNQYNQCLAANGYDRRKNGADQAALMRAQAACQSKDPLPPWELDANNPQAADFVHAVVQCLRAKGVRYVSEKPQGGRYTFSFGGPGNDADSISKGMQYTPSCEKQVAAQGIGH